MPTTFTDGTILTGPALTAALATATSDAAGASPVSSVAGRIGAITLAVADVVGAYASSNPAGYITGSSPILTGTPTSPTAPLGTSTTQLATTAFVAATVVAATTGVASFNTRTGAITLSSSDVTTALTFTPQSAAQVTTAIATETTRATTAEALLAPKASPTFTGTPAAPTVAATAAAGTTQIATTAFVRNGTTTNDNSPSGQVGEFVSSIVLTGAAVSLTTATSAAIATLSLTAGDWDVQGEIWLNIAGSTVVTSVVGVINTAAMAPATPTVGSTVDVWTGTTPAGSGPILSLATCRISLASTTTVYLSINSTFTTSTLAAFGKLTARRAR